MKHFDRFADWVADQVAHAWFFAFCAGLVVGWTVLLPYMGVRNQLWHLALNSPTTAITFLLVALLHNTAHRSEEASNERHEVMLKALGVKDPVEDEGQKS
jgi:low affinity Fe/Cu permease